MTTINVPGAPDPDADAPPVAPVAIGLDDTRSVVTVPSTGNLLIVGRLRTGKSVLARLLERAYRARRMGVGMVTITRGRYRARAEDVESFGALNRDDLIGNLRGWAAELADPGYEPEEDRETVLILDGLPLYETPMLSAVCTFMARARRRGGPHVVLTAQPGLNPLDVKSLRGLAEHTIILAPDLAATARQTLPGRILPRSMSSRPGSFLMDSPDRPLTCGQVYAAEETVLY